VLQRADEIRANAQALERRIAAACARAGRARNDVQLVAVSKTFPASDVEHAVAALSAVGAEPVALGENKVQEARDKKPLVTGSARWHLIGHLQSNKAKDAVRLFDVVQTVDSFELAERIARVAESAGKRQEILLQVNIGREPQKSGVDPAAVAALAKRIAALPSLQLSGLMVIPPAAEAAEETRPHFRELKTMRDDLGLRELSMGMTDDFEVAIEEGATIIRVGRAIFGSREGSR
jgi:hypothetical protein